MLFDERALNQWKGGILANPFSSPFCWTERVRQNAPQIPWNESIFPLYWSIILVNAFNRFVILL